jgi:hypothetical protein
MKTTKLCFIIFSILCLYGLLKPTGLKLFPHLVDQSQFNRRARSLRLLLNELRKAWANELGVGFETQFLLDTTPVVVVGYKRDKSHSDFQGSADYGHCASRQMKYFGYKFVMLTTLEGIPFAFELVPASTDERVAADEILDSLPVGSDVWSDKGFIGEDWHTEHRQQGINIWTAKRKNQHDQNPPAFDQLLNQVRQRIETVNDLLKEGGRSIEHMLAITVRGLCSRIIAKVSSITLKLYLRKFFNIDTVTFTTTNA